ncbi:MAG: hypothetical protein E6R04_12030 [Spirochaetes bacterium]|jgi:hypothetical protein|nr:MAG: hypothetical protein E6R04_12030 [Spirochaetota bacterium]
MMTVKELLESKVGCSPDGKHWEPAIPEASSCKARLQDAFAVLRGQAIAVRQTTKNDIYKVEGSVV